MSETVKSIIFAVIGAIIMAVGIYIKAGWEVIGLGAAVVVFAIICIIMDKIKANKAKK